MKRYLFEISRLKGNIYLQIWYVEKGIWYYVRSCGDAEKLNAKLVRLENLEKAAWTNTKEYHKNTIC